jgi:hypothetical protein
MPTDPNVMVMTFDLEDDINLQPSSKRKKEDPQPECPWGGLPDKYIHHFQSMGFKSLSEVPKELIDGRDNEDSVESVTEKKTIAKERLSRPTSKK